MIFILYLYWYIYRSLVVYIVAHMYTYLHMYTGSRFGYGWIPPSSKRSIIWWTPATGTRRLTSLTCKISPALYIYYLPGYQTSPLGF